ncbi:hypothetical protein GZH47_32645 (plasmid) [Paenibacillus rhizovicinus]|uniref:Uncharacterized protein n=1 Tax=Paenibacillus rhizovicinus TaxID=2704463 RepID=A0A6C0PAY3_9BACL|nr:hypothetical protein [Paenibacillus rhizovicinus]QHW35649.1 hypothetical protein GZH47_32645 [Paenibacillus rhizovicinus]
MSTTKILKQDLGLELQQLLSDLESAKGTSQSLSIRLGGVDTKIEATKTGLEQLIDELRKRIGALGEVGNFNEKFTYDDNGNVIKHEVTGDIIYTIDYVYADAVNGTLDYSNKKYTENGQSITIKKVYTYNVTTGNIENVATTTTIV